MTSITYGHLQSVNEHDGSYEMLDELLKELSDEPIRITRDGFANLLHNDGARIFVARDREVAGAVIGLYVVTIQPSLNGSRALIDHVVVSADYRRHGILKKLDELGTEFTLKFRTKVDQLTSANTAPRMPAHSAYKRLGFEVRDTTVFRRKRNTGK